MKFLKYSFFILMVCSFAFISCDMGSDSKPSSTVIAPVPTSPANNATAVSLTPNFEWTESADKLQISTGPNFESATIKHDAGVTGQSYTLPSGVLAVNSVYWWRVGKTYSGNIVWCNNAFKFSTSP